MNRRLGAVLLSAALVCSLAACEKEPPAASGPESMDADVVVVGAGGAGMTAAVVAAQAGRKVVILEKTDATGGNTSRATGGMSAAKTEWQNNNPFEQYPDLEKTLSAAKAYPELSELATTVRREYDTWNHLGYFDSADLMILDTMVGGQCVNDIDLVTTLAENSADGLKWIDFIGGELHSVGASDDATTKRLHRPADQKGKVLPVGDYLVSVLEQACAEEGVDILLDANVTEILMEGGRAVGVKTKDGRTINAKSVVLATGGFGANLDMVAEQAPQLEGLASASAPGCVGDGILLARAAGAALRDMDQIQVCPAEEQEPATSPTEESRNDSVIYHTMGGVVIDTQAQVLFANGSPIPGLYAAGEVTGGVHGADCLGGNALTDIIVFGRIAGANAAENAK